MKKGLIAKIIVAFIVSVSCFGSAVPHVGALNDQSDYTAVLGGYNVLIADQGNNRIIEVTPEKRSCRVVNDFGEKKDCNDKDFYCSTS